MSQPDQDPAVDLMFQAFDEAKRLNNGWVGTEHFLLALTARPSVAQEALAQLGLTYERLEEHLRNDRGDPDYPPLRYDQEVGLYGPNPAGHELMGRAHGIALASGQPRPRPEHWLLAMIYDTSLDSQLHVLGVSQTALLEELGRRGLPIPSVDPPVYKPWRGHRRVEVSADELNPLVKLLRERHPPGSGLRWGLNLLLGEPKRYKVLSEEGIDLEALVQEARGSS